MVQSINALTPTTQDYQLEGVHNFGLVLCQVQGSRFPQVQAMFITNWPIHSIPIITGKKQLDACVQVT